VRAQDEARARLEFQPAGDVTHCNQATVFIVRKIGGPLTPLLDGKDPALANQQYEQLARSTEYRVISADEAQQLADAGELAVGVQKLSGHGHIATVRPQGVVGDLPPNNGKGPLINNIGRFVQIANENWAFSKKSKVIYYAVKKK
jgi:hypothetical protein